MSEHQRDMLEVTIMKDEIALKKRAVDLMEQNIEI